MSASYKLALGEYVNLLRREPDNALLCLLIGLIYVHMACQRFSTRRHLLVIQVRLTLAMTLTLGVVSLVHS
jgi:general transcription factor 3C polypeptide 3 (transcription factor C subunit 4)